MRPRPRPKRRSLPPEVYYVRGRRPPPSVLVVDANLPAEDLRRKRPSTPGER